MNKREGQEKQKKLKLHRQTLKSLAQNELAEVAGGAPLETVVVGCWDTSSPRCNWF